MASESNNDQLTRREFISGGIGYAAAVSPITAWAIQTSTESIEGGDIEIPVGAEKMPGYWAMPKGKGPFPTVLVVQEIFGIHEYIKDVCRRLAKEGYVAVAPSLYFRHGDATKIPDIDTLRKTIVSKVSLPKVMTDLDATVKWLSANKRTDTKRLAITGFCWGGTVTWLYAAHNPSVKAGAAWYGKLTGDKSELIPTFPQDTASTLKVPVLGLYGEKDSGIPLDSVEKMTAALKKAGNPSEIHVFPGAQHGFHADYRPSYNAEAAQKAWGMTLAWFKKYGVK